MNWIFIAILGYFLLALEGTVSKYLLAGATSGWKRYLFFVSVLSLFSLFFSPWGLTWWGWWIFGKAVISGVIFFFSLSFLFSSLVSSAASHSFVLYGAISTLTSFLLMNIFFRENLGLNNTIYVIFLIGGSFFISFKVTESRFFHNFKKIVLAGFLAGLSLVVLKQVYEESNFVSGYIFSRLGLFLPALFFLAVPSFRKEIFSKENFHWKKRKLEKISFGRVLPVKLLAGMGTFLVSFSISIGNLTIINALVSVQYLLTFFLTLFLSIFFREFSKEKVPLKDLFFKLMGIVLIISGIVGLNFQ